jgi:hypothetical protein
MCPISRPFSLAYVVYSKNPSKSEALLTFRNKLIFYGEELLAPRSTPSLEDHPLWAVRDCLFSIFAATSISGGRLLHPQPEDAPCSGDKGHTLHGKSFFHICKIMVEKLQAHHIFILHKFVSRLVTLHKFICICISISDVFVLTVSLKLLV